MAGPWLAKVCETFFFDGSVLLQLPDLESPMKIDFLAGVFRGRGCHVTRKRFPCHLVPDHDVLRRDVATTIIAHEVWLGDFVWREFAHGSLIRILVALAVMPMVLGVVGGMITTELMGMVLFVVAIALNAPLLQSLRKPPCLLHDG